MKKLLCIVALIGLFAACGGGDNGATDPEGDPARTDSADATDGAAGAGATPDVEAAEEGTSNVPKAGAYVYDYESESSNAATPDATPRRSSPDAELSSKVTVDGDDVTIEEKSTEGPAVATVKRRYTDDGIVELSFETKSPQGTSGCTFDEPMMILPFPIEETELEAQPFAGEGTSCVGERTVTVGDEEEVADADGVRWTTRKVTFENVVRSEVGLSSRSELTMWFSPDLGREIKVESTVEQINPQRQVVARGETSYLLKSHPS